MKYWNECTCGMHWNSNALTNESEHLTNPSLLLKMQLQSGNYDPYIGMYLNHSEINIYAKPYQIQIETVVYRLVNKITDQIS